MTKQELLNTAKPILFNTEMVQAILEGRKTVTRRVIKHNPVECESKQVNGVCKLCDDKGGFFLPEDYVKVRAPYQPDNILYVRETWCNVNKPGIEPEYYYFADNKYVEDYDSSEWKWRPSIHMPKEAARIFLRVTDVRAELLHDIMEDPPGPNNQIIREGCHYGCDFIAIWERTVKPAEHNRYGWNANPWVWVISFETVKQED